MANKQLRAAADQVASVLSMVMRGRGAQDGAEMALRRAEQVLSQVRLQSPEVTGDWKMDAAGLHRDYARFLAQTRASAAPLQVMEAQLEAVQANWARGGGGAPAGKAGGGAGGAGKAHFQDLSATKALPGDGISHKIKYGRVKYGWKGAGVKSNPTSGLKSGQGDVFPALEAVFGLQWSIMAGFVLLGGGAQGVKYEKSRVVARMQDEVADARAASA